MPPLPLPSPWAESTSGVNFTDSGTVKISAFVQGGVFLGLHGIAQSPDGWELQNTLSIVGPNTIATLTLTEPGPGPVHTLGTIVNPIASDYFTAVNFSVTQGPWRLGVSYDPGSPPGGSQEPQGAADQGSLTWEWFSDETTAFVETVAGFSVTIYANREFGAPGSQSVSEWYPFFNPISPGGSGTIPGQIELSAFVFSPTTIHTAKFTLVTVSGNLLETTGMQFFEGPSANSAWQEVGAGSFDLVPTNTGIIWAPRFAGGISLSYDVGVKDYSGAGTTLNVRDTWLTDGELYQGGPKTPNLATIPSGVNVYATLFWSNWSRPTKNPPQSVQLTTGAPQTNPLWDTGDLSMVLDQPSPISGAATWAPVTIQHKAAIEVDRPDGGRPSHWSIDALIHGSVTEGGASTTFVVTSTRARFNRTFQVNWRNYINPSSPDSRFEGYNILKHNFLGAFQVIYPEDVWWWNSYSFLKLTVNASAAANLTIRVTGVHLVVNDPHGISAPTYNEVHEERDYVVLLAVGTFDYWIDLSFPSAWVSGFGALSPMWRPRVDNLQILFDLDGTFVLSNFQLARRDTYANQTSIAYPAPSVFSGHFPWLYSRVDGEATVILTYPDDVAKGFESISQVGGAIRYADVAGNATFNSAAWAEHARIEGFSYIRDDTQRQAFMTDAHGSELVSEVNENAVFAQETTPGLAWTGAGDLHGITPPFALRVGKLLPVPGANITIRGRKVLGGGIEAVGKTANMRAGAGQTATVKDNLGATIATVTTDARGRLHYEPLPPTLPPGNRTFTLGSTFTGIGTRETSHDYAVTTVPVAGSQPFNLTTRFGDYYEAYVRLSDVWFRASDFPTPPMRFDGQMTTTGDASEPRFCVVPRRRHFLCYTRPAGIFERTSDDDGISWNAETASFAGAKHPDIICSRRGEVIRAAYLGGNIIASLQNEGDASPGGTFTAKDASAANLLVQDDSFRIAWDPRGIWWLHALIQGDASPSLWFSADEAQSWTRYLTTFPGSRPGIAMGHDGTLLLWTYLAGTIQTGYLSPGNGTIQGPVTLKDATGANWAANADGVSFALAWESARRWVMVGVFDAEGTLSTWYSSDEAASTARFS